MSENSKKSWVSIADKVWIPLVVVMISAIVGPIVVNRCQTSTQTPAQSFTYQVRVQDQDTGDAIAGADVRIEIGGGIAPVDDVTDLNGIVMIPIDSSRAGKSAKLIVTASEYNRYEKSITLIEGALPNVIQLAPAP